MIVFVVVYQRWDRDEIVECFSTIEKAEEYIANFSSNDPYFQQDDLVIQEWQVR